MILVDDRRGSGELVRLFRPFDVDVESTRLSSGDFCFAGNGPHGDVLVGIERKRIGDFVDSMRSSRLAGHQLVEMCKEYQSIYIVVEGLMRPGPHGEIEVHTGRMWTPLYVGHKSVLYREVFAHLTSLEQMAGVIVRRTGTPEETVHQVVALYKWWQKEYKDHRSHDQIYAPPPTGKRVGFISREEVIRRKYGPETVLCWKMLAQAPGIDQKADKIAIKFRTVRRMAQASVSDWMKIPGVGKKTAAAIDKLLGDWS